MKLVILTTLFLTLLGCASEPKVQEYFVYERETAKCFKVTETADHIEYADINCDYIPPGTETREVDWWEEKGE